LRFIFIICPIFTLIHRIEPVSSTRLEPTQPTPQLAWQRVETSGLPEPHSGSAFVLNTTNEIALFFGGYVLDTGLVDELWLTDGVGWVQFKPEHSPAARSGAQMAYDEARKEAILFGGVNADQQLLGDTWTFNGVDWVEQHPQTSPPARTQASMSYDPVQGVTVLFGGLADTGGMYWEALGDTWIWDGKEWEQVFPLVSPQPRFIANMVYDRANEALLLFSGAVGGGFLVDTWLWDGDTWNDQHPLHQPNGRGDFGMTYDESIGKVILFGGQSFAYVDRTETWGWDGQDWSLLPTYRTPPEELAMNARLFYSTRLGSIVMYNGSWLKVDIGDDFYLIELSEVWSLSDQYLNYLPYLSAAR
jgi:hypothetical protein